MPANTSAPTIDFKTFILNCTQADFCQALSSDWLNHIVPGAKRMVGCSQGSQIHLEGDVAVHTAAVFQNFKDCVQSRFNRAPTYIELAAVLIHDIKKPDTRVEKSPGNVSFPGHEALAADETVPKVSVNLQLAPEEFNELDFLVRHHGDAHGWPGLDQKFKDKLKASPYFCSLALLQEADAMSCILPGGGCLPIYFDLMTLSS